MIRRRILRILFLVFAFIFVFESVGPLKSLPLDNAKEKYIGEFKGLQFEFCNMLSNSLLDENVYINAFHGTLKQVKPTIASLVMLIDRAAERFYDDLNGRHKLDSDSSKRYACYSAVSGHAIEINGYTILKSVDPIIYFPFLSIKHIDQFTPFTSGINPLEVQLEKKLQDEARYGKAMDSSKKRFKIAYLLMVHKNKECILEMITALYSDDAVYLIHVDANYPEFKTELEDWFKDSSFTNVHFMNNPFNTQWGSSTLVFVELEGFFQLLDLAEWDYVINISAHDYPMANTSTIHKILEKTPQKSYITGWNGDQESLRRLSTPQMISKSKNETIIDFRQMRLFPWVNRYPPKKQSQWMTLSRSFVEFMRKSQYTFDLLAYMEHSLLPDESFFSMLAFSPDLNISNMIIPRVTHYFKFNSGESHPITLHDGDHGRFDNIGWRFFARKIDASVDKKLKAWIDDFRNNYPYD